MVSNKASYRQENKLLSLKFETYENSNLDQAGIYKKKCEVHFNIGV